MADDERMIKATLAAGVIQAVLPTVTTNAANKDALIVEHTASLTEALYKKLFPPQAPPVATIGVDRKDVKVGKE